MVELGMATALGKPACTARRTAAPTVLRLGNTLASLDPRGGVETRLIDAMRQTAP